jgi:hypothetical protein
MEALASLCASKPIPIALDEELIGIRRKITTKIAKIIQLSILY